MLDAGIAAGWYWCCQWMRFLTFGPYWCTATIWLVDIRHQPAWNQLERNHWGEEWKKQNNNNIKQRNKYCPLINFNVWRCTDQMLINKMNFSHDFLLRTNAISYRRHSHLSLFRNKNKRKTQTNKIKNVVQWKGMSQRTICTVCPHYILY